MFLKLASNNGYLTIVKLLLENNDAFEKLFMIVYIL
jgi:hypothetical protein